jgi:hypothetical protein
MHAVLIIFIPVLLLLADLTLAIVIGKALKYGMGNTTSATE